MVTITSFIHCAIYSRQSPDAFDRPDSLISRSYGGSRSHGTIGYHSSGARSLESIDFIMASEADDNYDSISTLDVPMTARPVLPPSPTASMFSTVTSATAGTALSGMTTDIPMSPTAPITVKAAYNGSIVVFRGTRDVPFNDVRCRIRDKFIKQENIRLSDFFSFAIVVTDDNSAPTDARNRSSSLSSILDMDMKLISTPDEWRWVMSYVKSSKITLRVFEELFMMRLVTLNLFHLASLTHLSSFTSFFSFRFYIHLTHLFVQFSWVDYLLEFIELNIFRWHE